MADFSLPWLLVLKGGNAHFSSFSGLFLLSHLQPREAGRSQLFILQTVLECLVQSGEEKGEAGSAAGGPRLEARSWERGCEMSNFRLRIWDSGSPSAGWVMELP